jgi:hypothetical protein
MKKNVYMYSMEKREGKTRVENQDINGRISLKGILKIGWEVADLINLAQDRHKWRAAAGAMINFRILRNVRNLFTS